MPLRSPVEFFLRKSQLLPAPHTLQVRPHYLLCDFLAQLSMSPPQRVLTSGPSPSSSHSRAFDAN